MAGPLDKLGMTMRRVHDYFDRLLTEIMAIPSRQRRPRLPRVVFKLDEAEHAGDVAELPAIERKRASRSHLTAKPGG
jgi:hypothetical protein